MKPTGGLWFSPVSCLMIPNHGSLSKIQRFPKSGRVGIEPLCLHYCVVWLSLHQRKVVAGWQSGFFTFIKHI